MLLKGAPKVALLPLHYKMNDNWFLTTVSLFIFTPTFLQRAILSFHEKCQKTLSCFLLSSHMKCFNNKREKEKRKKKIRCQMFLRCYTKHNFSDANIFRKWKIGTVMDYMNNIICIYQSLFCSFHLQVFKN